MVNARARSNQYHSEEMRTSYPWALWTMVVGHCDHPVMGGPSRLQQVFTRNWSIEQLKQGQ
jgi:hypothetical protein